MAQLIDDPDVLLDDAGVLVDGDGDTPPEPQPILGPVLWLPEQRRKKKAWDRTKDIEALFAFLLGDE